ncbi:MAG: hypothetical protein ACJ74O_06965 [Frankiaceae bacterium]
MTTGALLVLAPLRLEARAVRAGAPGATVVRTGMGPRRATRAGHGLPPAAGAVAVAGLCGALQRGLRAGDVVVASEVRGPDGTVTRCAPPALVATALRSRGLRVHVGPLACTERLVRGPARGELATTGALAVDMESAWLAPGAAAALPGAPFTVVRVVVDTVESPLLRPATVASGVRALRVLRTAAAALADWAAAAGPRQVLLAGPRSFCAGPASDDVGSANSSSSVRLVEVARREGCAAHLVDDASDIDLRWLAGAARVGLAAGASAPPVLVDDIVSALSGLGPVEITERTVVEEQLQFQLPKEVS